MSCYVSCAECRVYLARLRPSPSPTVSFSVIHVVWMFIMVWGNDINIVLILNIIIASFLLLRLSGLLCHVALPVTCARCSRTLRTKCELTQLVVHGQLHMSGFT